MQYMRDSGHLAEPRTKDCRWTCDGFFTHGAGHGSRSDMVETWCLCTEIDCGRPVNLGPLRAVFHRTSSRLGPCVVRDGFFGSHSGRPRIFGGFGPLRLGVCPADPPPLRVSGAFDPPRGTPRAVGSTRPSRPVVFGTRRSPGCRTCRLLR